MEDRGRFVAVAAHVMRWRPAAPIRARMCSNPNTVVARRGVWKASAHAHSLISQRISDNGEGPDCDPLHQTSLIIIARHGGQLSAHGLQCNKESAIHDRDCNIRSGSSP